MKAKHIPINAIRAFIKEVANRREHKITSRQINANTRGNFGDNLK